MSSQDLQELAQAWVREYGLTAEWQLHQRASRLMDGGDLDGALLHERLLAEIRRRGPQAAS